MLQHLVIKPAKSKPFVPIVKSLAADCIVIQNYGSVMKIWMLPEIVDKETMGFVFMVANF